MGTKGVPDFLSVLKSYLKTYYAKPHQGTHNIKGLIKIWWMVKTKSLYINPEENGACLQFDVFYYLYNVIDCN